MSVLCSPPASEHRDFWDTRGCCSSTSFSPSKRPGRYSASPFTDGLFLPRQEHPPMSHDMSEGISWPSHTLSSPLSPVQGTPSPEHIVYYAADVKSPSFFFLILFLLSNTSSLREKLAGSSIFYSADPSVFNRVRKGFLVHSLLSSSWWSG